MSSLLLCVVAKELAHYIACIMEENSFVAALPWYLWFSYSFIVFFIGLHVFLFFAMLDKEPRL